jgi:hypothetical protein
VSAAGPIETTPGGAATRSRGSRVLRIFRFRPTRGAFDTTLRDVMLPDLARLAGLEALFVGRQGPDDVGERVNAMIWTSEADMVAGVGSSFDRPVFHPELIDETVDKRLDFGPIVCSLESESDHPAQVIRLLFGRTKPGEFDRYVEAARQGARDDIRAGHGPLQLHVAALGDDRFATLSAWGQWSTIAEATQGTIARPAATRHRELLADWHVDHYEAVPDVPQPTVGAGPRRARS